MPRLYFKYGTMGSSKTAQALMCKFNYEQKGMNVLLLKPSTDTRSGEGMVTSRVGLSAKCTTFSDNTNLIELYNELKQKTHYDVIIVDESNFCTVEHINQLKQLTQEVPVLCYGLLNNFKCELFPASKRLVELSDSLQEIKSVCKCGRKSTVNARRVNGIVVEDGPVILVGGDETYENMCYWCWRKAIEEGKKAQKEEK